MTHDQAAMLRAHAKGTGMARGFYQVGPITTHEYNEARTLSVTFASSDEQNAFMAGFRGERIRYDAWRRASQI